MRRAALAVLGLLLGAATFLHWFVVAGWCGFFDGGPRRGQEWACEEGRAVAWPILYAFLSVGALVWAARARGEGSLPIRLSVVIVVAALVWRIVPFELAPGGWP